MTEELIEVEDMSESELSEFISDIAAGSSELATLGGATEWCVALARRVVQLSGVQRLTTTSCTCEWSDEPWHDDLVAIESAGSYWAADLISRMVATIDGDTGPISGVAPNDFEAFIAEHNWNDPRQMVWLARNIQHIFECGRPAS
jgi:hypothetical protein